MSPTSSPPAFADPLAQEGAPPAPPQTRTRRSSAKDERPALLAPDVEGRLGAEAIDLVRSKGLIAAIETVEITGGAQRGLVIEQDPSAGTQMLREGVLTLLIGQAPAAPPSMEVGDTAEGRSASNSAASGEDSEDDTAEWFAALRPSIGGSALRAGAGGPRRRRKHRRVAAPVKEMVFDTPPDPLPAVCDPLPAGQQNLSQPVRPGPLSSAVATLLVRLPMFSVSPAWRRRALVLAGALVGLLVFTRGGGSHSHRQVSAPLPQISTPLARAAKTPALPRSSFVQRTPNGGPISRRLAAQTRRPLSKRDPRKLIVASTGVVVQATAEPASPVVPPVTSTPPVTRSPSAGVAERPGRFSYLGQ